MIWIVCLAVIVVCLAVGCRLSHSFKKTEYEYGKTPFLAGILLTVAWRTVCRRQGQFYGSNAHDSGNIVTQWLLKIADKLSLWRSKGRRTSDTDTDSAHDLSPTEDECVVINNVRITGDEVARYKRVCCEENDASEVPLCFPECLFMHNLLLLVCKQSFKFSPLGLIHVGQTITQHEDLSQLFDAPCSLHAQVTEYRHFPRGIEVDVAVRVIAASDKCVWSGVATLLSRSASVRQGGGSAVSSQQSGVEKKETAVQTTLHGAVDTGVKYAAVSGDWNPHHLYSWTARLLGYRSPIAHGLWTLARTVSLISASTKSEFTEIKGRFKRPLFLPGTATVEHYTEDGVTMFRVFNSQTNVPHLTGTLS